MLVLFILGLSALVALSIYVSHRSAEERERVAQQIAARLEGNISDIQDISDVHLEQSNVLMAKVPAEATRESYAYVNLVNQDYIPHNYYSHGVDNNRFSGWIPGMFSRLRYWNPGFRVHGWQYYLRPGSHDLLNSPQNRWVRHNGVYYFIHN